MEAFRAYKRAPTAYMYITLLATIFSLLGILASFGIIMLAFFFFAVLNLSFFSVYGLVICVIIGLALLWFISGVHGSRFHFHNEILNGRKYSMSSGFAEFLNYATGYASDFFLIAFIRLILILLPTGLLFYAYTYALQYNVPYIDVIFILIDLGIVFLICFLFSPTFLSLSLYDTGIGAAFGNGMRFLAKAHIKALVLYFLYAIVWVLNLIPLLNLFTLFIIYPMLCTSMISMFRKCVR